MSFCPLRLEALSRLDGSLGRWVCSLGAAVLRGGAAIVSGRGYAKATRSAIEQPGHLAFDPRSRFGVESNKDDPDLVEWGTIRPGTAVHYPAGNPQRFALVLETEAELNDAVEVERELAGYSHSARGKAEGVLRRCSTGCLQGQWKEGRSSRGEAPSGASVDDAIDAKHDVGGCGPAIEKTDDSQCLKTAAIPG
jgi:hypothetical protein